MKYKVGDHLKTFYGTNRLYILRINSIFQVRNGKHFYEVSCLMGYSIRGGTVSEESLDKFEHLSRLEKLVLFGEV